jgi:hypothetical protein
MVDLAQTRVVIRARDTTELYDLAFAVIRRDGWSLLRWWLIAAIPYLVITQSIVFLFFRSVWGQEPEAEHVILAFLISCAVSLPFSIAMSLMTAHLGLSVFLNKPTFRDVWRVWRSRIGNLLFGMILPLYGGRVALTEVVLLECLSPTTRDGRAAVRRRLLALNSYGLSLNQLGGVLALQTFVITGLLMGGFLSCLQAFEIRVTWGWALFSFQLGLSVTAGFNRLVRFFLYLNSRIKFEGWDVELAARAAALYLIRRLGTDLTRKTPPPSPSQPP